MSLSSGGKKESDAAVYSLTVSTATLGSSLGTGGMETKIIAAELATAAGCATVITLGSAPHRILSIVQAHPTNNPEPPASAPDAPNTSQLPAVEFATPQSLARAPPHTIFTPKARPLSSRRFWILHGLTPRGSIFVDEGAYRAIARSERDGGGGGNGGRLLAAGVLRVEGTFAAGQAVRVCVVKGRKGKRISAREPSRPGSPDHFADRGREVDLSDSVDSLRIGAGQPGLGSEAYGGEEDGTNEEEQVLEFGRGLTNYNSVEIDRIKGMRRFVRLSSLGPGSHD